MKEESFDTLHPSVKRGYMLLAQILLDAARDGRLERLLSRQEKTIANRSPAPADPPPSDCQDREHPSGTLPTA